MAIGTPISRGTATRSYSTADMSSGSFTPAADALLFAFVYYTSTGAVPSGITGHDGGTSWVQINSDLGYYNNIHGSIWGCHTGSSPTADTIDVTNTGSFPGGVAFMEVTGVDVSGTVANTFAQIDNDSNYGASASMSLTAPSDVVLIAVGVAYATVPTLEGTFTELNTTASNDANSSIGYDFDGGDATPTVNWSGSAPFCSWALELKAAAGGTILPQIMHHRQQQV